MGKLAVYKYFSFMFLVITLLISVFTFFALFGGGTHPARGTAVAMLVYVLPFLVATNLIVLLFWLIRRRWHRAAIPFITVLCSIHYIGSFFQFNPFSSHTESKSGIKIATYNVAQFGREITSFKAEDILAEMKRQNVDILCMQEFKQYNGDNDNCKSYGEHFNHMAMGHNDMVVFSRYPIKKSDKIEFGDHTNNSGMWADVDINGKLIRIFNVHLETTGFNRTMHKIAKASIQGSHIESNRILQAIFNNYTVGMIVRAGQADLVAREIKASELPVILCGDFNDVPYSYCYTTMKGDLIDGFRECGDGFMSTYRDKKKKVRIDYIFHSPGIVGEHYYKLDLSYSDHNPVLMKIAL